MGERQFSPKTDGRSASKIWKMEGLPEKHGEIIHKIYGRYVRILYVELQ